MKLISSTFIVYILLSFAIFSCQNSKVGKETILELENITKEKTVFQTSSQWMPEIDIRSDVAIIYGVHGNPTDGKQKLTFEERVKSWRDRGYNTHFMTGIAWGSYQDYFLGEWDGKNHLGEGQVEKDGDTIWHGHHVPYIVPTSDFIKYFKKEIIEKVINSGISNIYLEEPEFWARAGYSSAFKEEWQKYYGFPWRPQHESPENTYLSNKLKYELYYNAVKEVSAYAKTYGKIKKLNVKVYIPTHSLVNYSSWQIVSPEASLASLPSIDGYIAQVWTGTSREPIYFNGTLKERTFENAFLEYGSMVSMTEPTNRKLFFLTDPIEDRRKTWDDYKINYQATFTAQLLYPTVANYEVMPWPERIYTKPYQVANSEDRVLISQDYSTQMQVMINALNTMPTSKNKVNGTTGIGVLMGNSLMFQRFPMHNGFEDPKFSNFYGQTLPLLKRGIPVETIHMENLSYQATLKDIKILVMSYSNMKPENAQVHQQLSKWVKSGGVLIYIGRDNDPYQNIMEWWSQNENSYKKPSQHLFETLGIEVSKYQNSYQVNKGKVYIIRKNPKELVMETNNDKEYLKIIQQAYEKDLKIGALKLKNNFLLERGNYIIAAVLEESVSAEPLDIKGTLIDLFDPKLPVLKQKIIAPGNQAFLFDIDKIKNKEKPQVLCSASRVYNDKITDKSYAFTTKSPKNTINVMRILLPKAPKTISLLNHKKELITNFKSSWDKNSKTCWLQFENSNNGVEVNLKW